jgi:hypothetical protein
MLVLQKSWQYPDRRDGLSLQLKAKNKARFS